MSESSPTRYSSESHLEEVTTKQLVYLFFFLSGAAALMYEVIWVRLLGLVFGNTTFAVSTVLTAYMAGLGLGSYWIGRFVDRWERPLAVYGYLEIGIGAYAALTFLLFKGVQILYVKADQILDMGLGFSTVIRLTLSLFIFFIPTFFMGATLPVLVKFCVRRSETIGSDTALLYGLNTAGAVAGTLLAGFLLLPFYGMRLTLAMAVTLNLGVGLLALSRAKGLPALRPKTSDDKTDAVSSKKRAVSPSGRSRWLPAGLAISGATAMMYQIAWTRALAALLGSSTYAFTLMLATFLLGLALGSAFFEKVMGRRRARLSDWGGLQLGIALSALITLPFFANIGFVMVRLYALTIGSYGWMEFMRFLLCGALMIVPTFCFGALFPVTTALYTQDPKTVGRGVGFLYLANTSGNILGSLGAGFLLIPTVGIHRTLLIAVALSGAIGVATFLSDSVRSLKRIGFVGGSCAVLLWGLWAMRGGWDHRLIMAGLQVRPSRMVVKNSIEILSELYDLEVPFYKEGLNGIVSVGQFGQERHLRVNGKTDASTALEGDMPTQVLSGHLPHLLHPDPHRSLVIGFGSGTTLAAVLAHPIQQADCVEIEPAVLEAAPYFDSVNKKSYRDPRAHLILNDARNHLLVKHERYDIIISEPSNPWMAGVANLFTVEFYNLVRERLSSDGIFCQWIHIYSLAPEDVRMVVASVQKVFPHVSLWSGTLGDLLIIASPKPIRFPLDRIQEKLDRSKAIREDLAQFKIQGAAGLLSYFRLGEKDVQSYLRGAELNTDDRLPLEFRAPKSLYDTTDQLNLRALVDARTEPLPPIDTAGQSLEKRPELLAQIGEAYLNLGVTLDAKRYFQKALALDATLTEAQVGLSHCYLNEGKLFKAVALLENAERQHPKSAEVAGWLGFARGAGGDEERGVAILQKATSLDDSSWQFFFWKGELLKRLERWTEAAEAYHRSLQLKPEDLLIKLALAESLIHTDRAEEAIRMLETLRREFRTYRPIYVQLQKAHEKTGHPGGAIEAYQDLVRINPYRWDAWSTLAFLYAKEGNRQGVKWAFRNGKKVYRYFVEEAVQPTQQP